jgi:hypothetical protein
MKKFLLAAFLAAIVAAGVTTAGALADSTTGTTAFSGTGVSTLGPITVSDTTVLYWSSGGSSFQMYNVDRSNPNGEVGLTTDGSGATILPAGTYTLRIVTDGSWSITAVGPVETAVTSSSSSASSIAAAPASTPASPSALNGSGNGAVGPVTFASTTVLYWRSGGSSFQMKNDDRSNPNGEVGLTTDGSGATIVPAGTYTLDVATDGDWSITVVSQ